MNAVADIPGYRPRQRIAGVRAPRDAGPVPAAANELIRPVRSCSRCSPRRARIVAAHGVWGRPRHPPGV